MAAANSKKNILVMDSDEISLYMVEQLLLERYSIFPALSGRKALDFVYRKRFIPDLILLDLLMPDIDGWDIYDLLKATDFLRDVPIAFLTSLDNAKEKKRASESGVADYITKPYCKEAFITRIEAILIPSVP